MNKDSWNIFPLLCYNGSNNHCAKGCFLLYKNLVLFSFIILLLVGCSSISGASKDLRKELYDDSVELFRIIDESVNSATPLSEAEKRKVDLYFVKYDDILDRTEYTDSERETIDLMREIRMDHLRILLAEINSEESVKPLLKTYLDNADLIKKKLNVK